MRDEPPSKLLAYLFLGVGLVCLATILIPGAPEWMAAQAGDNGCGRRSETPTRCGPGAV